MQVSFRRYVDLLGQYMIPDRRLLVLLSVGLFANIGLQLLNPQILRYFIDAAVATGPDAPPLDAMTEAAVAFLAVAIVIQLVSIGNSYVGSVVAWNATNALREDLASHCLRLDMTFHQDRTPGELIQRIDGDVGVLGSFFSSFLIVMLGNTVLLAGSLVVLYLENVSVGAALTVSSGILLGIIYSMRGIAVKQNVEMFQAQSELYGFIEERLSGKEDVRALGAFDYVLRRLHQFARAFFRRTLAAGYRAITLQWTMMTSFAVNHAVALGVGVYLHLTGEITLGTVFMIVQYMQLIQGPLMSITGQFEQLQRFRASVERVEELLGIQNRIEDGPGPELPSGALPVRFDRVSFSYDEDHPTLRDVSFELAQGEVLGLLGRTGSGKSTLAKMLFRFYDVGAGEISLAGRTLTTCSVGDLRGRVGMVTQDVQLFRASVRDNLSLFDPGIGDGRILQALGRLGLDSWLEALPRGLDTELGTRDLGLSAGEAQLLAFARVFLRDPGLVVLDEASSRLDPATEQRTEEAMDELLAGRTAIVIAHRLRTVARADKILILEDGAVVETGDRETLERDGESRFSGLLRTGLAEEAL